MISIEVKDDGNFLVNGRWVQRQKLLKAKRRIDRNEFDGRNVPDFEGDISFIKHPRFHPSLVVIRSDDNFKIGVPHLTPDSHRTMDESLQNSPYIDIYAEGCQEEWAEAFEQIKGELSEHEKNIFY